MCYPRPPLARRQVCSHPTPSVSARFDSGVATLGLVKMLRRALVALSLAGTIAGLLRLKGKGGVPPQEGGWREVSIPPR